MKTVWFGKQKIGLWIGLLAACGGGGNGESTPTTVGPLKSEITMMGSIKSVSGSQSEMKDWVIALVGFDSGLTSVGVVNAAGNFALPHVLDSESYTLALLDPQFKLAAVLSSAGDQDKTVKQVFKLTGNQLPILAHNGPIISFTNLSGIAWDSYTAKDSDGDLIPDGKEISLVSEIDTDNDGIANSFDPDIDGDGLLNALDLDDDGDGIPDAFDTDANGDGVADTAQSVGDLYFSQLLSYGSVQVIQDTQGDGSFTTSLLFTSKLRSGAWPTSLSVLGYDGLFEGAQAVRINPDTGDPVKAPWDLALLDDGMNEDGAAGDGTYVRRVQLAIGKIPRAQQVVFYQYRDETSDGGARVRSFPFMFPDVVSGAISGAFAPASRTVTLTGTPFGPIKTFKWSVDIYSSAGKKVFVSEPVDGAVSTYVLPSGILETGASYTARIVATSPERLPSYPSWIVRSAPFNL